MLSRHLIDTGKLTWWQCEKLRAGKWKGFFLDGYCILRQISKDTTSCTYLVREAETGKLLAMRVIPVTLAPKDGRIHYEIHDLPDWVNTADVELVGKPRFS